MAIPHATVIKLQDEGINDPDDLTDFTKDSLMQVAENLRKPGDRIPNPDPNAPVGSTIPRPSYVFGAKSQKRLLEACELVRFYETIGRPLTAPNIQYDPVIKDFMQQWKALTERKTNDGPEVPKITKALPLLKWTEAFDDFLSRTVGSRTIPYSYVTRESEAVPADVPALATNKPHSEEHGSVEGDLVARASHVHPLYRDDNSAVYYFLEEATRGTSYAASLKPYQRAKDGRGAYFSLQNQYAGRDKWETELKRQDQLLHTRTWKGQSNFSLEKFIAQHRNAYVSMTQCAEHVDFQLPNEHTRVGYLLDAIETNDAGLQAAIAQVRTDEAPNGKRNNFELTASYLLPYDPVAKKRTAGQKRDREADVGDVTADVGSTSKGFGTKSGVGKTGVHLRYHTHAEYQKLSSEERTELREWRESQKEKGGKTGKTKKQGNDVKSGKRLSKTEISAISKQVAKHINTQTDDKDDDEDVDAIIKSLQSSSESEPASKKARLEETTKVNTSALKSILRRAKNSRS